MSLGDEERVFFEALQHSPEERDGFVADACDGDERMLANVRALLASHADADRDGFLADSLLDGQGASLIGRTIDRYRIVRQIGVGGMGAVYLAERADETFDKQVAIKIVRGLDTPEALARFHGERQTLARLEHPHIARLLDGGTTDEGRPYFVMEYVDGERIDRFCTEHRLPLPDRLRVFLEVCAAVQFAHRNLVVHRDLKPGNVVVDREGTVKLLDFGIAKALDPQTGSGVDPTQTRQGMFTPAYASPEQVRGEPISTATDVYALGVMLFELLTGRRPYRIDESSSIAEIASAVCDEPPGRPSRAIEGSGPEVAQLRRSLEGDLEAIVLKALRKEPERRYLSVAALADDLRAYLERRPVSARPDSLGYRFNRFARRNRALVTASALGLTALVVGLVTSTWLYLDAEEARAEQERQRLAAESTGAFLASLLESIDPELAGSQDTALLERILDDAARRVELELADTPDVAARLQVVIGNTYNAIGRWDLARDHLEIARSSLQQRAVDGRPLAEATLGLAVLSGNQGRMEEALRLSEEAQSRFEQTDGAASLQGMAEARLTAARALNQLGRTNEAIERLRPNLEDPEIAPGMVAESLRLTGRAHVIELRTEQAIPLLRRARDLQIELHGDRDYRVAGAAGVLGWAFLRANRLEEADAAYRESESIYREVLPDDHPDIASALTSLGGVLQQRGAYEEAEDLFQEALERFTASHGPDHMDVGTAYNNLGFLYVEMGRHGDAERNLRSAIATYGRTLGESHVFVGIVLQNLIKLFDDTGRLAEARTEIDRAWGILSESFGAEDFRSQYTRAARAMLRDDPVEAERELIAAEAILAEAGNDTTPRVRRFLADVCDRLSRPDDAAAWRNRAAELP